MDFAQRLAAFRKERSLTQQSLADRVAVHLTQINRYETGDGQPMLKMIPRPVIALSVTTAAKRVTARAWALMKNGLEPNNQRACAHCEGERDPRSPSRGRVGLHVGVVVVVGLA